MSTPSEVIKVAQAENGYLEKKSDSQLDDKTANAGSGNYTRYWKLMKPSYQGQPWCQCFCNFCFVRAFGEKEAKRLLCTTGDWSYYTPTSAQYFKDKKQWYTSNPQPGDLIYFKNTTRIHHVGLVTKVSGGMVSTIEGNTSAGTQVIPNGGGVFNKSYYLNNSNIAGYGRPAWNATQNEIKEVPITCGRAGLKIVGASTLNVRKAPETGEVVKTLKIGDRVQATAKALVNNVYWFKIGTDQWISGKYIEGWVFESNKDAWWFVKQGYSYDKNKVVLIDNAWYAFDKDGWCIMPDRMSSDGSIKMI